MVGWLRRAALLAAVVAASLHARANARSSGFSLELSSNNLFYDLAGSYVDDLERDADALPPTFIDIVHRFMSLDGFAAAFGEEDVSRTRILSDSHAGAGLFLQSGSSAITLDSLIIFRSELYTDIIDWNRSWDDVVAGRLSPDQDHALFLALHELVHVRQFRELGRQAFLDEYLPAVMRDGDQDARLEQEAYAVAPNADSWARRAVAAYAAAHARE
jgi:hypothetical protein